MTVKEIKQKVHRNGDTKKYRKILAELNDVPVSVINAVLDDTLMPKGYCISDGKVQKAQKIKFKEKELSLEKEVLKRLQRDLKT